MNREDRIEKTDSLLTFIEGQHLLTKPIIFQHFLHNWAPSSWTFDSLQLATKGQKISVKVGEPYNGGRIPLESECELEDWDMSEFCLHLKNFKDKSKFYYAAYNHLINLVNISPNVIKGINWDWTGISGLYAKETTLWLGTVGSFTPCHRDSYGYNLHAQISGRKEWLLWPPDSSLEPTRLPYEESSVFSSVDVLSEPWCSAGLKVILEPGQVLLVPKHWWHLVRSLDNSISINTWIKLASDDVDRVEEAVARFLVCSLKTTELGSFHNTTWLNLGETATSSQQNIDYLTQALHCISGTHYTKPEHGKHIDSYSVITNVPEDKYWYIKKVVVDKTALEYQSQTSSQNRGIIDKLLNAILDPHILEAIAAKLIND